MDQRWCLYTRVGDDLAKLILSADVPANARPGRSNLILFRLPYAPQENNFPDRKEMDRLQKLEEKIVEELEKLGAVHVGHVTASGEMVCALYSAEPAPKEISVKTGFLKTERFPVETRSDPNWNYFATELEPTPAERMRNRFNALHATLNHHGDEPSATRAVDFAAYFKTAEGRSAFLEKVLSQGFTMGEQETWEGEPGDDFPFWCEFVKTTNVEPESIAQICVELDDLARSHGGEFDGWACPVTN